MTANGPTLTSTVSLQPSMAIPPRKQIEFSSRISRSSDEPRGIVAIIPARGGSKGVPRKNVLFLGGQPVITWTIEAALDVEQIDNVFVSTEDDEISEIANAYGAMVIERPHILASDEVQLPEVVTYCLRQINYELGLFPDTLVVLQADSPFKTSHHIREALAEYDGSGTVFSAFLSDKMYWRDDDGGYSVPVLHNPQMRVGRQWINLKDRVYQENGAIYIAPAWRVSQECNFRVSPYTVYVMAEEDSLQIDSPWDWEVAQLRMESNLSRNPLANEHD